MTIISRATRRARRYDEPWPPPRCTFTTATAYIRQRHIGFAANIHVIACQHNDCHRIFANSTAQSRRAIEIGHDIFPKMLTSRNDFAETQYTIYLISLMLRYGAVDTIIYF